MVDPLYAVSGFAVGALVGMTGVGGGSLMTPLLILLFGVHPATAVGTDLLYAAATKTGGSLAHGLARSIDWSIVKRLAFGSLPATVATLWALSYLDVNSEQARSLITVVLCAALVTTAGALAFRNTMVAWLHTRLGRLDPDTVDVATIVVGVLVGILVSISSVGAGAIGIVALIALYPDHPVAKLVGSDIAHAVPLTLVAGIGHWFIGAVDWHIIASLLAGSLPGIALGSYLALRIPESVLRIVLAMTLLVVAGRLAFQHLDNASTLVTAFTRRAIH